jgi:tRNA threonylcarbamoyladenosine biosynthesis protein TsaE
MEKFITKSEIETAQLAEKIALRFTAGGVLLLIGDLGSGKTTFTQFFAQALGIKDKVISPTFVLIRSHKIDSTRALHHIDLYRLSQVNSTEIGLNELLNNPKDIVIIEWADKLEKLPKGLVIKFKKLSSNEREIKVY